MNIEQLNGSGQRLSVFMTTAVVTLAVTGGSWFVIEQVNSYRKWRRRRRSDVLGNGRTQFALVVRLAMLVYLASNGYTQWMWKSGAWWRILLNHRSFYKTRDENSLKNDEHLTAAEYVSKYIMSWSINSMHFDEDEVVQWIDTVEDEEDD